MTTTEILAFAEKMHYARLVLRRAPREEIRYGQASWERFANEHTPEQAEMLAMCMARWERYQARQLVKA